MTQQLQQGTFYVHRSGNITRTMTQGSQDWSLTHDSCHWSVNNNMQVQSAAAMGGQQTEQHTSSETTLSGSTTPSVTWVRWSTSCSGSPTARRGSPDIARSPSSSDGILSLLLWIINQSQQRESHRANLCQDCPVVMQRYIAQTIYRVDIGHIVSYRYRQEKYQNFDISLSFQYRQNNVSCCLFFVGNKSIKLFVFVFLSQSSSCIAHH